MDNVLQSMQPGMTESGIFGAIVHIGLLFVDPRSTNSPDSQGGLSLNVSKAILPLMSDGSTFKEPGT
jgi:hypothetical protein